MKQHPPRPATDLFPESLNLSPKQRLVLDTLSEYPDGARVSELAEQLNMHVNTIRGHLDELAERHAIHSFTAPAIGRGRPSLIYKVRIPDNRTVAVEYITLIEVMGEHIGRNATSAQQAEAIAHQIGQRWARALRERGLEQPIKGDSVEQLGTRLRSMGFDPIVERKPNGESSIAMHSCPLATSDYQPTHFVCAVHEGALRELLGDTATRLDLHPYRKPGTCHVELRNNA